MNKKEFYIPSSNRKNQLHTILWLPDSKEVKGIVQISHGMVEYIDRYERFASFLVRLGYAVIGNDHLGHGLTAADDEELGYMPAANASAVMVKDLHRVSCYIKMRYPEVPFFLLGHSMGSFLARRYAMTYPGEMDGLILLGTGYQPKPVLLAAYTVLMFTNLVKGEHYRSHLMQTLAFWAYNLKIPKRSSKNAWITRDEEILKKYNGDKYCSFQFTIKGFKTLFDTLWFIEKKENIKKLSKEVPVFFVAGTKDPVGNYSKGVKRVIADYKKAGIKKIDSFFLEGARHEVLNELEYEKAQKEIAFWIQYRMEEIE